MTGIFKANNPPNNVLLLLYGILLKMHLFIQPPAPQVQAADAVLYQSLVMGLLKVFQGSQLVFSIIAFILLYIQAISFNKLVNDLRLMPRPNYLVGMSYLLITSIFAQWFALSAALIINTILIWVWARLCTLHNAPKAKTVIYNIGLVIGIACFIYYPAIVFTFLFIAGISITRPFRLNEWLIGLLGISTAFYFFGAWLFLTGQWKTFNFPEATISMPHFLRSVWPLAGFALLCVAVLVGIFFVQRNMRRLIVQTRKSWQLVYLYLFVAILIPFINQTGNFTSWILVAVPASLLMACALFYPDRKWFPLLVHWGLVTISVVIAYFVN